MDNTKWNLEFWGQMTGWLDFRVGKEKWDKDMEVSGIHIIFVTG